MLKINIFIFSIIISILLIYLFTFKANGKQEYNFCLKKSYDLYKKEFMSKDGRIMDPEKDNITTSEGQSYIMIRSVLSDDKPTFKLTYNWAKNNLQRKDKLFAWLWGKNSKGKYKILDNNSAADADVDITFSLFLAYEKWKEYKYLEDAKLIMNSIWDNETKRIDSNLVLMPGAEKALSEKIEVNPSYFSPYAFRYFQKYDELHDWSCLIDSSYYYLNTVMSITKTGLPPNWFLIQNGKIILEESPRGDFSYDAIRVFARIYLDYVMTKDERALPILDKSKFFINEWEKTGELYVNYTSDGELSDKNKFIGSIGILAPIIKLYNPKVAKEIYKQKLESYLNDSEYWEQKTDYYGKNLLWFGCYLYNLSSIKN